MKKSLQKYRRLGALGYARWVCEANGVEFDEVMVGLMDNHAIHRGRWVRERLLGGGIPDVPITVDAMLPNEPRTTLRERMRITREKSCWNCHQKIDPLGLPFEMFSHAGLYRTEEWGEPVDTSGEIIGSGDPSLDGPVENALQMPCEVHRGQLVPGLGPMAVVREAPGTAFEAVGPELLSQVDHLEAVEQGPVVAA